MQYPTIAVTLATSWRGSRIAVAGYSIRTNCNKETGQENAQTYLL
jgi:hypothetical protein